MDIEQAKALAAGPLGRKMAEFPLLFAKIAFFGQRPSKEQKVDIANGTVTLADLGAGPLAITCQHVVAGFREQNDKSADLIFQIGDVEIDVLGQLVAEDARRDIATIRLTPQQVQSITAEGEIGSSVFRPVAWPSAPVKIGDFVTFGGFPGSLKTITSFDEIEFGSWSSGGSEIVSASAERMISTFDRDNWVRSFGQDRHMDLRALGGMSGGPVLIQRGLYWDLVGIVTDYEENYDAVFFASLNAVKPDGTIEPLPMP